MPEPTRWAPRDPRPERAFRPGVIVAGIFIAIVIVGWLVGNADALRSVAGR